MTRVLLIDDDKAFCELLTEYLTPEDFTVTAVHDGEAGIAACNESYDVVILDVMMPKLNGFEVLRKLRESSDIPVLMLTARGEEVDRIVGFEMGADDYIPKPCNPRELLARLKAILRRAHKDSPSMDEYLEVDDIIVDDKTHQVLVKGEAVELTLAEYNMLKLLLKQTGQVISKEVLCETALSRPLEQFDRSIDVHISRLRHKLGPKADGNPRIRTIRGVGYLFEANT
ncbi:MAG: DNA-binding response regulator [Legionellales bacterium]|nr:DNA-binding response regulator [Legionellales bacterium]|tara:strand:- start:42216 stop:42899 length:684 start_codon:yes stop_codon:yes gene_type:complete